MNFLEFSFSQDFSKLHFLPRQFEIGSKNTAIFGHPKSGKTSLALSYIQTQKQKSLYVDLRDLRIDESVAKIQSFIDENAIEIVILDGFNGQLELPTTTQTILICEEKYDISNFKSLECRALDFEEFLIFDKKHQNITASFNFFLKFGNLPQTVFLNDSQKIHNLQDVIKLIAKDESELLFLRKIFSNAAFSKSIFQLYTSLKKEMKVSKDRFYKFFDEIVSRNIIKLVYKIDQPKSNPKIMLCNHSFFDAVSTKKNFNKSFENLVFLELLSFKEEIFYTDGIDFFIPKLQTVFLCIPFFNQMSLGKNINKLLETIEIYDIEEIKIISIATTQKIFIGNIEASVESFYEWALTK